MNATITRTVLLALALLNQVLAGLGYNVLDIDDSTVENLINTGFTVVTALSAWWYNNSFTAKAKLADDYLKRLKAGE